MLMDLQRAQNHFGANKARLWQEKVPPITAMPYLYGKTVYIIESGSYLQMLLSFLSELLLWQLPLMGQPEHPQEQADLPLFLARICRIKMAATIAVNTTQIIIVAKFSAI